MLSVWQQQYQFSYLQVDNDLARATGGESVSRHVPSTMNGGTSILNAIERQSKPQPGPTQEALPNVQQTEGRSAVEPASRNAELEHPSTFHCFHAGRGFKPSSDRSILQHAQFI
jgi:hypothetical protein